MAAASDTTLPDLLELNLNPSKLKSFENPGIQRKEILSFLDKSTETPTNQKMGANENSMSHKAEYGFSTRCSHSGTRPSDWAHSPIMPPVYLSTTYEVLDPANAPYDYSRSGNPTRTELELLLARLESAKYALAFSSGLGTLTTITYLLETGQHILCSDDVYGGTYRYLARCVSRMGIETSFVDGRNHADWEKNFRQGKTKLVWIETPTNPMMKLIDIEAISKLIKRLDSDCIIVVDNTFITPVFQSPLRLGADIVVHSCSKYIGGHSDIIMGCLMTNNQDLHQKLSFLQNALGIVPAPFDCSQAIRSIKTLEIRVRKQTENAAKVAEFLEKQANVERVIYPGLESHPDHELAKRQCSGFGAMISFYLRTVDGGESVKFMNAIKIAHAAVSLGCVSSLIEAPALMTHGVIPVETRNQLGLTDNLIRMSVGIETLSLIHI